MGDEKLGDVMEAVLSLARPGSPWRAQVMLHTRAITEAVELIEAILRWAQTVGGLPAQWPSSRVMADLLS